MTQPRTVIDIVGAKAGTHQLLKQIGFFVAALGAAKARQCIVAVRIADSRECICGEIERFVPGGFTKYIAPVLRVQFEVCRLGNTRFANQRLCQSLTMMCVIESIAPLDTEATVIGWTIAPVNADDRVVFDVIRELATNTTIRTDAIDRFVGDNLICALCRRQRTGRAGLHTFAAGHTGGYAHGIIKIKYDFRLRATERVTNHVVHLLFAAGAHTTRALDACVEIDRHCGMRKIRIWLQARFEAGFCDAEFFGPTRQFVGARFVVFRWRVGGEKFQHHLLRRFCAG